VSLVMFWNMYTLWTSSIELINICLSQILTIFLWWEHLKSTLWFLKIKQLLTIVTILYSSWNWLTFGSYSDAQMSSNLWHQRLEDTSLLYIPVIMESTGNCDCKVRLNFWVVIKCKLPNWWTMTKIVGLQFNVALLFIAVLMNSSWCSVISS
jgi:hypothetical protein